MPQFNQDAVDRIRTVVRRIEADYASNVGERRRYFLDGDPGVTAFEAKTSGGPGDTAQAWSLKWNADTGEYDEPDYESDPDLTIVDAENCHRWIGYDDAAESDTGARGFCDSNGGIISVRERARVCLCQLTAAQTGSDSSFSVDTVTPLAGQSPVAESSDTLTAYNVSASAGADNAVACVEFNETSGHWEVQWIVNTSQSVVTDYQIDGANKKFQKKTRTAWANWAGSESGWTDVHTGGSC